MRRREPPSLATWMLRHLAVADRDEALDGDLLEVFRTGRSNTWYWRQVVTACLLSWCNNLYARGPALFFALLWSMLSPVWHSTIERLETSQVFDKGGQIFGLFWLPLALAGWIVLHATFLWAALLVYRLVHAVLRRPLQKDDMQRALWLVPLVFPLVYGATFLVANLYWYSLPGLAVAKLAPTSWGRISDLGILANFIRFPYFVTLLAALWGTVHRFRYSQNPFLVHSGSHWDLTESDLSADTAANRPAAVRRFFVFMVAAGLVNSMIAALFLCRLPDSHSIDFGSLVLNAITFVTIGTVGGIVGSWLYWMGPASPLRHGSPVPFSLFAFTCATGWMWVPAMMLFAEQVSGAMAFVAMIGASFLALGLRSATYFAFVQPSEPRWDEGDLFAESLYRPSFEPYGYLIALGLFVGGASLVTHSNYTAATMLAMSASIFAWRNTVPRTTTFDCNDQIRRAMRRVSIAAIPAILLTMWALLDGIAHRNQAQARAAASGVAGSATHSPVNPKAPFRTAGPGGYESVVLWPYPDKKEITPPLAFDDSLLEPSPKRPLIIRFDGPYWFLQPPSKRPGPEAHVAQGTPVSVDLESNNAIALVMNAHQKLSRPIPTGRCGEIAITIENRDNKPGVISLGVLLTDESSSPKRTLYLGEKPIASTEPEHFFVKTRPLYETVRFSVQPDPTLRKFNEISVIFLPDIEHTFVAPKIAIQQFELFSR